MKGEKTVLDVTIREARKNKEGVHFTTEHLILELFCEEIERIGGAAAGMIETRNGSEEERWFTTKMP